MLTLEKPASSTLQQEPYLKELEAFTFDTEHRAILKGHTAEYINLGQCLQPLSPEFSVFLSAVFKRKNYKVCRLLGCYSL
jgi:hypothetical protein